MQNKSYAVGGVLLLGLAAGLALPKVRSKGQLALRRATGTTYRSGVSRPGTSAGVDPARGIAAGAA